MTYAQTLMVMFIRLAGLSACCPSIQTAVGHGWQSKMILKAILLSMVVASISFFISHSELFSTIRAWIEKKSQFFGNLIDCCYCLGHWVAFIIVLLFDVKIFDTGWGQGGIDIVLTWLAISWMAGLQSLVVSRLWGD